VKGRDLYDYVFYLAKKTAVNLKHLAARLVQSGYASADKTVSIEGVRDALCDRFAAIDYEQAKKDILPFMAQFPLKLLHFFGQESILAPCEANILSQPKEVYDKWLYLAEKLCEREEFLSWSEHLMYVGLLK
jgi:hypothetical protein